MFKYRFEASSDQNRPFRFVVENKLNGMILWVGESANRNQLIKAAAKAGYNRIEPCQCKAYKFPHRLGSGKCNNQSLKGPFCGDCGCSCVASTQDEGIGSYEFWGAKGVHHDWQVVSDCCGATCYHDQDLTRELTMAEFEADMVDYSRD